MAYSTSAPPSLIAERIGNNAAALWVYSNTDTNATVYGAGYITNGSALGMKKGDIVFYSKTDTPTLAILIVTSVTAGGAANLGGTPATAS